MADVVTRLRVESSEYDSRIKRAAQSLNEMTTAAEREGNKIATANKENIALAQSLGKMATVSTTARGKMSELSSAIEAATIQYNRLTAAEKKGQFGKALNTSITQLQGRLKTLSSEMAVAQAKMSGMGIGAQFGAGLKSAFSMLGPTALAIGGVTAAIGGMKKAVGDMVRINMQFEQGTAVLASIIGKTTDEISALTDQAKQLGATTRYTAMQITELQTNLARLGFSEQEILNSTKAIQAFATATGADLGEAANLAGAALRGFGMNATEMERAASVMAVSTTKSALSFEKLATAVPIVAPVAKQFGFTIEDTITLLGKLSDAGMDASTAATATRNIFLKMADGSGKLSQAMGKPVHSVEEFGEALSEMRKKGMDLNDILKMVGVRSTAAFAVFADNAETLKDFKQSITDCGDAMGEMENKQLNTLQGSITILNSAWEGLMLTFSESNGTIKTVVDSLTNLLSAWTRWRNRNKGGDAAISTYEMAEEKVAEYGRGYIESDRAAGMSDSAIKKNAEEETEAIRKERDEMQKLLEKWEEAEREVLSGKAKDKLIPEVRQVFGDLKGGNWTEQMRKMVSQRNDQIAINDYIVSALSTPTSTDPNGEGKGGLNKDKSLTAKKRAQIEAQMQQDIAALDKANMIKEGKEEEYEDQVYAIKKAALEQIKQLYAEDTKEYAQVLSRSAQLDIQYQNTKLRLAQQTNREITKSDREAEREKEAALRHQKQLDNTILRGLTGAAKRVGWNTQDLGVEGVKTKIDAGIDITEDEWTKFQDKLNERLMALGLDPIQINFETGNIEQVFDETKAQYQKFMDDLSSGVGAISTLGNAFNDIKGSVEDLTEAFSGDMDAWDALMTVFNSGIGIMQTVIGVMEAINTLQELAGTLSDARVAKQQAETMAVVTGKGQEMTAEVAETGVAATATGVDAGEAAAKAGKSVAGIPIVGPILAVAAIATVLAAVLAAVSKAKSSAGKFASGGIVPGNSYSGDQLTASVNSGEVILNHAQSETVARQLTAGDNRGGGASSSFVTGENIVLGVNNFLGRSGQGEIVTTSMLRRAGINL